MTPRATLTDLQATAPAESAAALARASDAYDEGDMETVATTLFAVSHSGQTSWHQRANDMATALDEALDNMEFYEEPDFSGAQGRLE